MWSQCHNDPHSRQDCRHHGPPDPRDPRAVVVPVARRRTDRDDGLEQLHVSLGLSQDVDGLAAVVGVLLLLNGDDAGDGVGVLVVQREVGDAVVLVVGQQDVVAVPGKIKA